MDVGEDVCGRGVEGVSDVVHGDGDGGEGDGGEGAPSESARVSQPPSQGVSGISPSLTRAACSPADSMPLLQAPRIQGRGCSGTGLGARRAIFS